MGSVTHCGTLGASFTVKNKSSFQGTSYRQVLPSRHNTCQLLWHSITPSMASITRASSKGTAGRATPPLIGWMAPVMRAGMRRWAHVTGIMTTLQQDLLYLIVHTSAVTERICDSVCACGCSCTCYISTTKILLRAKWEHFWEVRTFLVVLTISKDCLRVKARCKVKIRIVVRVRSLVVLVRVNRKSWGRG